MTINGWQTKYSDIRKEFGYSQKQDLESAKLLSLLVTKPVSIQEIRKIVSKNTVFVVGSGPSVISSIPILKKYKNVPKIIADSAVKVIVENKILPDIVVTDLDGDIESLKKIGKSKTIFVVHAHGDNVEKLPIVENFRNCIMTTQTKSFGKVYNFGGFTDGDRCVFLANHFKAKNIVLFGMDFGDKIGKFSKTKKQDRKIKLKKLHRGKKLLEWLSSKSSIPMHTCSTSIRGFKKICYGDLKNIIIT